MDQVPGRLNLSHLFLFMLLFSGCYLSYKMIEIYLHAIIFALILTVLTTPLYERITRKLKGRTNLAAAVCTLMVTIVVVIPLFFILMAVIKQGIQTASAANKWIDTQDMQTLMALPLIEKSIQLFNAYMPKEALASIDFPGMVKSVSANAGKLFIQNSQRIIGNITTILLNFTLMIFIYFFAIQKQKELFTYIFRLMPLSGEYEKLLVDKIKAVSRSAILGTLITSAAQGAAGGIAFAICGLPGLFWGVIMAFASLIPLVGTALVWVPAAGYLFLAGHFKRGIFLVIWSIVVVGMIDNLLRPLFMKGSAGMNTVLIFFSIIGGLNFFGLIGLLYGPLIFGITLVLFYIYELEFNDFLNSQDEKKTRQVES